LFNPPNRRGIKGTGNRKITNKNNAGDCCGLPPSNKSATYWVKNEDMYKASEICRN